MNSRDIKQLIAFFVYVTLICWLSGLSKFATSLMAMITMIATISMAWVSYCGLKMSYNPIVYVNKFKVVIDKTTTKQYPYMAIEIEMRNVGNYLATDINLKVSGVGTLCNTLIGVKNVSFLEVGKEGNVVIKVPEKYAKIVDRNITEGKSISFALNIEYGGCHGSKIVEYAYSSWGAWVFTEKGANIFCQTGKSIGDLCPGEVTKINMLFHEIS